MENVFVLLFFIIFVGLLIAIIKPEEFTKIFKKDFGKNNLIIIFSVSLFVSFFAIGFFADSSNKVNQIEKEPIIENAPDEDNNNVVDKELLSENNDLLVNENLFNNIYKVSKVIDGDTIDVINNGETKRIRLIGVDTPEYNECYGSESTNVALDLLLNQEVKLESDPTQGDKDKYDRLLRYVFRSDGLFFNEWMIESGYAYEYTYNLPYKYQEEFKNAEIEARTNKNGLWADGVCQEEPIVEQVNSDIMTKTVADSVEELVESKIDFSKNIEEKEDESGDCVIKGNISSNGYLYHTPQCPSYSKTVINESKGERWFCSESEALAAGWTKANNCP